MNWHTQANNKAPQQIKKSSVALSPDATEERAEAAAHVFVAHHIVIGRAISNLRCAGLAK